jgi:signal peptidase
MEPTLQTGGVAFVEPKRAEDVQVGDVLTFKRPDNPGVLVTHRVTSTTPDAAGPIFTTRGDANEYEDGWTVPAANVIGTVKYDLPYLGYVTQHVRTRMGFLLVIGLPAALIVLGEIKSIVGELRKERAPKEVAP